MCELTIAELGKSEAWLRTRLTFDKPTKAQLEVSMIKEKYAEMLRLRKKAAEKAPNEYDCVELYSAANKIEDDLIETLRGKCLRLDNGKYLMVIHSSEEDYGIGEGELIEDS